MGKAKKEVKKGLKCLGEIFGVVVPKKEVSETFQPSEYESLLIQEAVVIYLNKAESNWEPRAGFDRPDGTWNPAHWRCGKMLPVKTGERGAVFFNLYFYGISEEDFGTPQLGTVEVKRKTTPSGRVFVFADFIKTPEVEPGFEMKFPVATGCGIPVVGTDREVVFRPKTFKKK